MPPWQLYNTDTIFVYIDLVNIRTEQIPASSC